MDLEFLKQRLNSYRNPMGRLTRVPNELLLDILKNREQWVGPVAGFYDALGVDPKKIAGVIGRAKKLKQKRFLSKEAFKEIKLSGQTTNPIASATPSPCSCIEVVWDGARLIRFSQVDDLVAFLKKVS